MMSRDAEGAPRAAGAPVRLVPPVIGVPRTHVPAGLGSVSRHRPS